VSLTNERQHLSEFDSVAANYQTLVTESVRVSGESSDYFAGYKARYLRRLLAGKSIKRVLDYGCGVGSLAKHLHTEFPQAAIDGFDPSPESIREIDQSLREHGSYVSNLENLGGAYDLVVIANVLHHVSLRERQSVLEQAFRRLASGAYLVVFEHNPLNPLTRWAVSQCPFDEDAILLRSFETEHRFRLAGFDVLRRDFVVFFPRWLAALRSLETMLHWCPGGAQYAVVGCKSKK
jgi:2-polyprenyl-3-methyl-5-hydroxy-6-metoxy-1,4-benzoquinol methylase